MRRAWLWLMQFAYRRAYTAEERRQATEASIATGEMVRQWRNVVARLAADLEFRDAYLKHQPYTPSELAQIKFEIGIVPKGPVN
jgi:hypothetical protein